MFEWTRSMGPGRVADLPGGGGLGGLNPHPPPLGLPSKNLMCIEKRHHYVQTHTVCSYSILSQAQPQTIGFNTPPPPWAFYGLHCVSRCQENIVVGSTPPPPPLEKSYIRPWGILNTCSCSYNQTNLSAVHGGALCPLVEIFVDVPIVAAQDGGEHLVGEIERVCEGDGDGAKEGEGGRWSPAPPWSLDHRSGTHPVRWE